MNILRKSFCVAVRNLMSIFMITMIVVALFIIQCETGSQAQQVIISEDTTWTLADSPYIITGNVLIEQGKSLTIEPGVEVKFDEFYFIQIEGKLVAEGAEDNIITFTSNKISPEPGDWDTIKIMNNANNESVFNYCKIEFAQIGLYINEANFSIAPNITHCEINNNSKQGLMYYAGYDYISPITIKKEITNNSFLNNGDYGIDIEFFTYNDSSLLVSNNVIRNNEEAGINFRSSHGYLTISHNAIIRNEGNGIYCREGKNVQIRNNIILFNNGNGIIIEHEYLLIIEHNAIINNSNSIKLQGGGILLNPFKDETNLLLRYNNIYNNIPYDAENDGEFDRNITDNWWGTNDTDLIEQNIYDYYDDFNKGKLNYIPILVDPDSDAPDQSESFIEPPIIPAIPFGAQSGFVNISYFFSTVATEPYGDQLRYGWDWNGDGTVDEWSDFVDSGSEDNRSHTWIKAGIYNVRVKAEDEYGAESGWSDVLTVTITIPPNESPTIPTKPSGSHSGEIENPYSFSTSSTDPDNNMIKFGWDWNGDGVVDEWSNFVESGATDTRSHAWLRRGSYNVKVKAVDEYGGESEWSDGLKVKISDGSIESETNSDNRIIISILLIIIIVIVVIALMRFYLRKRT